MIKKDYLEILGRFSVFMFILGFFIGNSQNVQLHITSLIIYGFFLACLLIWIFLPFLNQSFKESKDGDKARKKFKKEITRSFFRGYLKQK